MHKEEKEDNRSNLVKKMFYKDSSQGHLRTKQEAL